MNKKLHTIDDIHGLFLRLIEDGHWSVLTFD